MKASSFLLLAAVAAGMAGCQPTRSSGPSPAGIAAMARLAERPIDPNYMKALDNLTTITFSPHGPQVSYRTGDGRIWLWYPGNPVVLSGEWKALETGALCYKYGANTNNPLTGSAGGRWECQFLHSGVGPFRQERKGDIFGLSKRSQPPFVMRKDRAQYEELVAKLPPPGPADRISRGQDYQVKRRATLNEAIHAKNDEERRKIAEKSHPIQIDSEK